MKNIFWVPVLLTICCLSFSCGKDDCDKKISAVQPNNNPVGYEVLIKTNGFTNAAKVVFGSVTATSRAGGEGGDIIAKVPAGVSGHVEISVEEGDCIARSDGFIVPNGLPNGVQPSIETIIIPTTPTIPPSGIGNVWINAASTFTVTVNGDSIAQHTVFIREGTTVGNIINFDEVESNESINSVTNRISGFANLSTLEVQINIDRTSHGGSIEHFNGQFIKVPDAAPIGARETILLVSRETGRQLLIYHK